MMVGVREVYRYGFNGMEKDDEIKNIEGSSYDFGARMYDPRLGRWLSIDPLASKYPSMSPYSFCANNPILFIDPNGKEISFPEIYVRNDGTIIITMKITAKIIDETRSKFSDSQMNEFVDRAQKTFVDYYGIKGDEIELKDKQGNYLKGKFEIHVTADISIATETNALTSTDHAIRIVNNDKMPAEPEHPTETGFISEYSQVYGYAPPNQNVIYIAERTMLNKPAQKPHPEFYKGRTEDGQGTFERTLPHELGHSGDLKHPEQGTNPGNFMVQTGDNYGQPGKNVDPMQMSVMIRKYINNELNQGEQKAEGAKE